MARGKADGLYYEVVGDGEPLVLLDHRVWDGQFARYAGEGYRTIRYDRRGRGRSERPAAELSHVEDLES